MKVFQVYIYSKSEIEKINLSNSDYVISFFDVGINKAKITGTDNIMYIELDDLEYDEIEDIDYFFPEAIDVARFIEEAVNKGSRIICQCEYGQGRSAGCAAAIIEYYNGKGIDIFADYKYFPNKVIYHKVINCLNGN